MKKAWIYLVLIMAVITGLSLCDKDDDQITYDQLPEHSKSLIETYFADVSVASANKDVGDDSSYEVVLSNGIEIRFLPDGSWREIDGKNQPLPKDLLNLLPAGIADYLATNYSGFSIVKIERESNKYELELNDATELQFSADGQFLSVDNTGTGIPDHSDNSINSGNYGSLPQAAKDFLETWFADVKVTRVEYKAGDSTPYEVHLKGGIEIEFNANGNWQEINGKGKAIPTNMMTFLPSKIMDYVTEHYAGQSVVKIEKEGSAIELELSGGTKLKFNASGEFIRSDD